MIVAASQSIWLYDLCSFTETREVGAKSLHCSTIQRRSSKVIGSETVTSLVTFLTWGARESNSALQIKSLKHRHNACTPRSLVVTRLFSGSPILVVCPLEGSTFTAVTVPFSTYSATMLNGLFPRGFGLVTFTATEDAFFDL